MSVGGESSDQSTAVPKLNFVPFDELFGRLHRGGIVWVIAQKFGGFDKTMTVDTENIGAIISHGAAPLRLIRVNTMRLLQFQN